MQGSKDHRLVLVNARNSALSTREKMWLCATQSRGASWRRQASAWRMSDIWRGHLGNRGCRSEYSSHWYLGNAYSVGHTLFLFGGWVGMDSCSIVTKSNLKSLWVILNLWVKNLGSLIPLLLLTVFNYGLGKISFFIWKNGLLIFNLESSCEM